MVGSERLHADNRSGFYRRIVEDQQKRDECESGNRRWKHPDPIVLYQPTFRTTLFYSWGSEPERRACGTSGRLKSARSLFVLRVPRSEEHTSELQSRGHLVCRLLLEKKKKE